MEHRWWPGPEASLWLIIMGGEFGNLKIETVIWFTLMQASFFSQIMCRAIGDWLDDGNACVTRCPPRL